MEGQRFEMFRKWLRKRIDPLHDPEVIVQGACWLRITYAERNNGDPVVEGESHFSFHML